MIQAVIFDMDGLLIDSEPLWQAAEIKVFDTLGVPLTPAMTTQTMGLRTDEVVHHWHKQFPWSTPSQEVVAQLVDDEVIELIKTKGEGRDGVDAAVAACESLKLPMAIASSSSMVLIKAVVKKLGLEDKIRVIHSAHDESHGKPHPAVYL